MSGCGLMSLKARSQRRSACENQGSLNMDSVVRFASRSGIPEGVNRLTIPTPIIDLNMVKVI